MPELPEVEALRRALDEPVRAAPIERAGPAHVATLKTFDPPLSALEGRWLESTGRRGKHLLFCTEDDDPLYLHIHLMTAGRLRYSGPGEQRATTPAFQLTFTDGGALVLTEAGAKKRAQVGLYRPEALDPVLGHLGPEANLVTDEELADTLAREPRRLHSLLRDQRALAGIGRAWANEILHAARLSPYAISTELADDEVARLGAAIRDELARGLALRERGAGDKKAYRVHDRLGEPCPACGTPIAQVDFEEHTIYYCPACQTAGRILADRRLSRLLR